MRAQDLLESRYRSLKQQVGEADADRLQAWYEILADAGVSPGIGVELGSGAGNLSLHLAEKGWQMTGFELSQEAVDWANERAQGKARFYQADLGKQLETLLVGQCDLVLDGDCYHYMLGTRREVFLENACSLLSREGLFVLRTITGTPPEERWEMLGYVPLRQECSVNGVPMTAHYKLNRILIELAAVGYEVTSHQTEPPKEDGGPEVLIAFARQPRLWGRINSI